MLRRSLLFALVISGCALAAHGQQLQIFDKSVLVIDTASGPRHFDVELAVTPAQEEQGLMYRQRLAPDAGMLFVFDDTAIRTFWMRNTMIPLDMLFIAPDGRIVDIHERAVPLSENVIPSREPARAVLELNGGTAARLGIKIGDVVHFKSFGNAG
ncbi:MAG: DUF192 domain-containing protein [Stellaceae bacterium]